MLRVVLPSSWLDIERSTSSPHASVRKPADTWLRGEGAEKNTLQTRWKIRGGGGIERRLQLRDTPQLLSSSGSNQHREDGISAERTEDRTLIFSSGQWKVFWSAHRTVSLNFRLVRADGLDAVSCGVSVPLGEDYPNIILSPHPVQFVLNSSPWRLLKQMIWHKWIISGDPVEVTALQAEIQLTAQKCRWIYEDSYLFGLIYARPVQSGAAVMTPVWCRRCAVWTSQQVDQLIQETHLDEATDFHTAAVSGVGPQIRKKAGAILANELIIHMEGNKEAIYILFCAVHVC